MRDLISPDSYLERPILVTGSAGFIGSNFVVGWIGKGNGPVISLDNLSYAGNLQNLQGLSSSQTHMFVRGDIGNTKLVSQLLQTHKPLAIINFAAETHVDRSILSPDEFLQTNVIATQKLLHSTKNYFETLSEADKQKFRFIHISTDEVFGSLDEHAPAFSETSCFAPNSPYAASKAASDHFVRAYHHTYGLPTITTNCSNNYGPFQYPEKLIPLIIHNSLRGELLPIYGDGKNIRDWLYVTDHCEALETVLYKGQVGETYNLGGNNQLTNIDVVHALCDALDKHKSNLSGQSYRQQIKYILDRPGHDRRYAMNITKAATQLGWRPRETFASGIEKTVIWYLENQSWTKSITGGAYLEWVQTNYKTR